MQFRALQPRQSCRWHVRVGSGSLDKRAPQDISSLPSCPLNPVFEFALLLPPPAKMKKAPSVSVIMPCFNCAEHIEQAIQSALAQSWADFELIVVDDGSTDDSTKIVEDIADSRVQLVKCENGGVARARNIGLQESRGEYISFLDSDDYWHPTKLQRQIDLIQKTPGTIIYSSFVFWFPDEHSVFPDPANLLTPNTTEVIDEEGSGYIFHLLLQDVYVWTGTILIPRAITEQLGKFDESLKIGEDYDYWLRAAAQFPFAKISLPLALYRQNPRSITSKAPDKNYQAIVLERHVALNGLSSLDGRNLSPLGYRKVLARIWNNYGAQCIETKRFSDAAIAFTKAISAHPFATKAAMNLAKIPLQITKRLVPSQQ